MTKDINKRLEELNINIENACLKRILRLEKSKYL